MSLDGYIADPQGGVDWLVGEDRTREVPDSYDAFVCNVDVVIMGWNTYHKIVTELSPEKWVYEGLQAYVITHRSVEQREGVVFTDESPCTLVRRLKQAEGRSIWICGGADIVGQLLGEGLIDMFHVAIIPILLGGGTRLFGVQHSPAGLQLVSTLSYNGIVEVVYRKRDATPACLL